ncbi:MerR family transcriptional regulator [soil metagenome]
MIDVHHQIGEVAEQVDLSLRTIRYYEEIGIVTPSGRTDGGFRLYTASDIDRLKLVKALKPIGMPLEVMTELLECADRLAAPPGAASKKLEQRLDEILTVAALSCQELEEQLDSAKAALRSLSRLAGVGSR